MLNSIYSLYDRKSQYYLPVFNLRKDADAIRQFTEIVTSSDTLVSRYPADYDLVRLAEIDVSTGQVLPLDHVHIVLNGLVCLENAQRERHRYATILSQGAEQTATDA
nr:MAG: nonstructural protein [Microvirus sp.]